MTVQDALNRGYNLVGTTVVALSIFVITVVFLIWQYVNVKRLAETAKQEEFAQ